MMRRRLLSIACLITLLITAVNNGLAHTAKASSTHDFSGTLSVYDFAELSASPTGKKLIAQYMKMHPNVKIKIAPLAPGNVTQYQESVLAAGTASDLFVSTWAQQVFPDVPKGYWTDLTPYLNAPSPYVTGNKHWKDTFVPSSFQQLSFLGKYYVVSPNAQDAMFFYNKDLFAKAGIMHPPTTWADLIDDSKLLKKAGSIPDLFFLGDTYGLAENSTIISLLENQVMGKTLTQMDTNHDGTVDLQELVTGIKKHIFSPMKADYQEAWKLLKQWSTYWQPNAISNPGTVNATQVKSMAQWLRGQAGMVYVGTVQANIALSTVKVPFKWGVFKFPQITSASSSFATLGVKGVGIWGADNGYDWGIPSSAAKQGTDHLKLAVDFLQWITAPQNNAPVSVENLVIPVTVGWKPDPKDQISTLGLDLIKHPTMQTSAEVALGLQWIQRRISIQQDYITGVKSLSQAMTDMQTATDQAADQAIKLYKLSVK